MKLFIKKHKSLPTEGGMGGGAEKMIDGWVEVWIDGQTDKETGIGKNKDGPADPPLEMG